MQVVQEKISLSELKNMSEKMFGDIVKAVVDIQKEIMVVDAALHAEAEWILLVNGSQQESVWGINIYPEKYENEDWIEFNSLINVRPSQGNKSIRVEDCKIREKIIAIVNKLVIEKIV